MDPLSQGSLGAALAQSGTGNGNSKQHIKAATLLGCCAGLAPDLDILIFSPTDPLLFLEFHRQFTHSLFFIPIGALLVAAVLHPWLGRRPGKGVGEGMESGFSFRTSYLYCLLGYATHGLLDACTTYGTQLLWPFSDLRVAWNSVSIIDPLFTLPIIGLIVTGIIRRQPWFGRAAILWALAYLCLGIIQRDRAMAAGYELAAARGHTPVRLEAKPGFANLLLWKLVYEADGKFHVDAVRVGASRKVHEGETAIKLNLPAHFPWLPMDSQQARDVERFRWFSNDYLALDPAVPNRIIDVRYSVVPNEIEALWAIDLSPGKAADEHINWVSLRRSDAGQTGRWWRMLME